MASAKVTVRVSVRDVPELIAEVRGEMAWALRKAADAEASAYVKERLCRLADDFEAGQAVER